MTIVAAVLAISVAWPTVPLRTTTNWMCPSCGSMKTDVTWLNASRSTTTIDATALDRWMTTHGGHNHTWQFIHERDNTGRIACGSAPSIYSMRSCLEQYVTAATDAEIASFVQIMTSGNEREQQQAIDQAATTLFGD